MKCLWRAETRLRFTTNHFQMLECPSWKVTPCKDAATRGTAA